MLKDFTEEPADGSNTRDSVMEMKSVKRSGRSGKSPGERKGHMMYAKPYDGEASAV